MPHPIRFLLYLLFLFGLASCVNLHKPPIKLDPAPDTKTIENPAPIVSKNGIQWRVENPFPLFKKPEDSARWLPKQDEKLTGSYYDRISEAYKNGQTTPYKDTTWSQLTHEYEKDYLTIPENHKVQIRLNPEVQKNLSDCKLTFDNKLIHLPKCHEWVSVEIPYNKGKKATTVKITSDNYSATTEIQVEDTLVVSMGDSYASGQGSPDKPSTADTKNLRINSMKYKQHAEWWDTQCNRSLLSGHAMAAMKMATAKAGRVVRFASFACSGAEINDGLLIAQKEPPVGKEYFVTDTQIDALKKGLCNNKTTECSDTEKHPIDTLMLSIGGNDVGFVGAIKWAILPGEYPKYIRKELQYWLNSKYFNLVCPNEHKTYVCKYAEKLSNRYNNFVKNLEELSPELNKLQARKIIHVSYPNPLRDEASNYCNYSPKREWDSKLKGIRKELFDIISPVDFYRNWSIAVRATESKTIHYKLFKPLNQKIRQNALNNNWIIANDHVEKFKSHGWCANEASDNQDYSLPMSKKFKFEFHPDNVRQWKPYARMNRFIRTPNDSLLTQGVEPNSSEEGEETEGEEIMKGAFHPTAEGYALIGESIYNATLSK